MRTDATTTATGRIRSAAALVVLAVGLASGSAAAQGTTGDLEASAGPSEAATWTGARWTFHGRRVDLERGWLVVDGVRGQTAQRASDHRWVLRARRLVARVRPPGVVTAWWASGDVRVVGPSPVYATGRAAVSLRPGRSVGITGDPSARLLGSNWNLAGRRIVIDMREAGASVVGIGNH